MEQEIEELVRNYIAAVANQDREALTRLLSPEITLRGPIMELVGIQAVLESFQRISAIHVRSDIRRVFVDGNEACVIYDFVTDAAGSVPTIEWLRLESGKIRRVDLYYDQLPWQTLRAQLAKHAQAAAH